MHTLAHALEPAQVGLLEGVHGDEGALPASPCQLRKLLCPLDWAREAAVQNVNDLTYLSEPHVYLGNEFSSLLTLLSQVQILSMAQLDTLTDMTIGRMLFKQCILRILLISGQNRPIAVDEHFSKTSDTALP